jgi:hypothetical protein
MKRIFPLLVIATLLVLSQFAPAQTSSPELKHFAEKGLSFDYPAANALEDHSSPNGQHLVIQSAGTAQVMIVFRYTKINSPTELAAARHEVLDTFIETMWKEIHTQDENVSRTAAQVEVAGVQATGVKLRAVLNNEPGNAEIYSLQLGHRLVVLSLIGTDREIAATAPAWLAIRRSLKIEASTDTAGEKDRQRRTDEGYHPGSSPAVREGSSSFAKIEWEPSLTVGLMPHQVDRPNSLGSSL